ncbi:hypothetical protein JD844_001745 [Phrynosoma platyrhinos]|uniref:Fibronectin type-II domain-containing protein n=1 Tax=Phrynosoma platyrhinos TaxID=52577 RepID=A0ABQ7TAA8_PHRPL|nr:hypothetical protein JD844_001745 [Phrynosoma platyrhinos]
MMQTPGGHTVIPQNPIPAHSPLFSKGNPTLHAPRKGLLTANYGVPPLTTMTETVNGKHVPFKVTKNNQTVWLDVYFSACVFPFIYQNKTYRTCTKDGSKIDWLWCATTSTYDKDHKWKRCYEKGK